jgi:peroxiredoxin Q/BCP
VAENAAFAKKFGYTFPLLCDTDRKIGLAYGAASKPDAGHAARISYVIDENGIITHTLKAVDPSTHTDDVLKMVG